MVGESSGDAQNDAPPDDSVSDIAESRIVKNRRDHLPELGTVQVWAVCSIQKLDLELVEPAAQIMDLYRVADVPAD